MCATRFTTMFSPSLAIEAVMRSATFSPSIGVCSSASAEPACASRATARARSAASRVKSSVRATKSVSQPSSTMPPRSPAVAIATIPSLVARPSRLPAFARPRSRNSSTARLRSPPASARTFLQSIMPAPVCSRSAFTACAEISATLESPV
jgi:hypothetical protein